MDGPISRGAFERLVHEHHAAVFRTAQRIVGPEDGRDATQQVFLAVLEGRLRVDEAEDVGRLLRWKAARVALSIARSGASRRRREEARAMDAKDHASEGIEEREQRQVVWRELAALPEGLREVLVLRYVEGLTLAEVGAAMEMSAASAHERVQKALGRLKRALSRAGLAGAAAALPGNLVDGPPAAVPPSLLAELLRLRPGTAAASAAVAGGAASSVVPLAAMGAAGGAALLVVAALVGGGIGAGPPPAEPAARVPARAGEPAASPLALAEPSPGSLQRGAVAGAAGEEPERQAPGREATGSLRGTVLDPAGTPLAGVAVLASSLERKDKRPRFAEETRSGHDGRFRLELPVAAEGGQDYHLSVVSLGHVEWTSPALRIRARAETVAPDLRLVAGGGEEPGSWELAARVVDADGEPVSDAIVRVLRRRERGEGLEELRRQETSARSDAEGRVHLRGELLGPKRLVVDARPFGLRLFSEVMDVLEPGALAREVVLAPGLEIAGRLRTIDGSPLGELRVYAFETPSEWLLGELEETGEFRIRGLEPGTYRLRVDTLQGPWSHVLREVEAGEQELHLVLKRRDDPRDVGDHSAELHGSFVERARGALLELSEGDYEVRRVEPASAAELWSDQAPLLLAPSMWQRMLMEEPRVSSSFHVTGLEQGTYMLVARARGHAPGLLGPLVLGPSTVVSDLRLELGPGAALSGRVLDLDGAPLEDARVVLIGVGPRSDRHLAACDQELRASAGRGVRHFHSQGVSAGGAFRCGGIPAGLRVRVAALHPEREPVTATVEAAVDGALLEVPELRFLRRRER